MEKRVISTQVQQEDIKTEASLRPQTLRSEERRVGKECL